MIIYLYKKTHKTTGLKYLGKTIESDPYLYQGSGVYWTNHIKKHGYDCDTEILKECSSKEELREWGLYYSNLWNIVESDEWANLKPETGDGGAVGPDGAKIISEKIKEIRNDPEWKSTVGDKAYSQMMDTRSTTEWQDTVGKEARKKQSKTINDIEWLNTTGQIKSKKISEAASKRTNDPVWQATIGEEQRAKERETKTSEEWLATTGKEMKSKMTLLRNSEEYKAKHYKTCEYCGKFADPGNYKIHHGDRCKHKNN